MWYKWWVAALLGLALVLSFNLTVQAASPTRISMVGKAAVVPANPYSQLRLKLKSTDSSEWLLETALNPQASAYDTDTGTQVINVTGSFTLGTDGSPLSTGAVTGWWSTSGYGEIYLASPDNSTNLDLTFTIAGDGLVTSQLQGQWPSFTGPANPAAGNSLLWFLSRTAAILAYILLFINMCLGLGLKTRFLARISPRWRILDLHRFTALLALALVMLHILSLLGDSYYSFGPENLFIPLTSPYRPVWTTLGVIGFYLLLVISLSAYFGRFIGPRIWRVIHYAAFALFFIILVHGIKSGTDTSLIWDQALYIFTGATVVFLSLWRFLSVRRLEKPSPVR